MLSSDTLAIKFDFLVKLKLYILYLTKEAAKIPIVPICNAF